MTKYLLPHERRQVPTVLKRHANGELRVQHAQMGRVAVDANACTGCKMCVRVCPARALEMDGIRNVRMIGDYAACVGCGDCIAVCKPQAIELTRSMTYEGLYKHIGRGDLEFPRCF